MKKTRAMELKRALLCGLIFAAGGCHGAGSGGGGTHVLASDISEEVLPGDCAPIEGPYAVPDGTSMDYTVTDLDGTDDMDVAIIDDADGCSFATGYGVQFDVASISSGDDSMAAGNYDFVVRCRNVFSSCLFSLSWSASY
ncbi:MAG TPA: hypothetical protein VH374_21560 [Polyangia bacterium]|jgi:hypothetical protein|nr:hypothetical protein [Polyangia bacterium]